MKELDATQKKELMKFLKDGSATLTQIEASRDFIKTTRADLAEEMDLNKKVLGKLLKVYHKGNFSIEEMDFVELKDLFEVVTA